MVSNESATANAVVYATLIAPAGSPFGSARVRVGHLHWAGVARPSARPGGESWSNDHRQARSCHWTPGSAMLSPA
jgi:hypothetical protein